jgi:NADPH:quinone reductase
MRAMLCSAAGTPEDLTLGDIDLPPPGQGEVAVAVHTAGVNFADSLMIAGTYQEKPPFPFSPGLEAAGIVTEVGPGVRRVIPGDRVVALVDWGAYAAGLIARESDVFPIPEAMDFIAAASLPITYGTAHGSLTWRAKLQAGEVLLVHGAAGGVGLAAVEVGKALGATVIATARGASRLAIPTEHGADHAIDTIDEDIRERVLEITDGRGADVIFDPIGGDIFDASLRCAAWGGRLLIIGFAGGRVPQIPANILLVKNLSALGLYWGAYRRRKPDLLAAEFAQLFAWYGRGHIKPRVSHSADLAHAAKALALLRSRQAVGKIVLTVTDG